MRTSTARHSGKRCRPILRTPQMTGATSAVMGARTRSTRRCIGLGPFRVASMADTPEKLSLRGGTSRRACYSGWHTGAPVWQNMRMSKASPATVDSPPHLTRTDLGQAIVARLEAGKEALRSQWNASGPVHHFFIDEGASIEVTECSLKEPFEEIQQANRRYVSAPTLLAQTSKHDKSPTPRGRADVYGHSPALADIFPVGVSSKRTLVGAVGIEPTTARV